MIDLAAELKKYRNDKTINQESMARLIGIGFRTYQTIESTGVVKKQSDFNKIIKLLGISEADTQKITVTETEDDFFGLSTATMIAIKAALKIITKKLIEEEIRRTKKDKKIVSQEFDKAMKEEYNQLLQGLRKK